ncbi:MAG: serine/threonine-protein kinase [Mycobacterium sp.]
MGDAGSTFGDYLIDREVGRGGHAVVYRAHRRADPAHMVALKVLHERHRTPAEQVRLDREFEFAHALDHPNIVTVYERGPFWLTMQLIGGVKATRLPTLAAQLRVLAQIADALDYTHHSGIVHCDVKPANILVPEDFQHSDAVLIDFGAAHAVVEDVHRRRQKHPEVSLPYAAPEMLLGQTPSAATDEYSLACTAVELITGKPPFTADNAAELAGAQLRRQPHISEDLGRWARGLDVVLTSAMAKDPDMRYRSCTELVDQITRVLRSG